MQIQKTVTLPSGGPLKIDAKVTELLLAQMAIMCAPRSDEREKQAIAQRKSVLESLNAAQRGHARTVCSILLRLLDEARCLKGETQPPR
jgi:hypothetical protein